MEIAVSDRSDSLDSLIEETLKPERDGDNESKMSYVLEERNSVSGLSPLPNFEYELDNLRKENSKFMQTIQDLNEDRRALDFIIRERLSETEIVTADNDSLRQRIVQLEANASFASPVSAPPTIQNNISESNDREYEYIISELYSKSAELLKELDYKIERIDSLSNQCNEYKQTINQLLVDEKVKNDHTNTLQSKIESIEESKSELINNVTLIENKLKTITEESLYQKERFSKVKEQHQTETVRLNQIILEYSDDKVRLTSQAESQSIASKERLDILSNENENLMAQLNELSLRHITMNEEKLEAVQQLEIEKEKSSKF